jgi:hypothetical protein
VGGIGAPCSPFRHTTAGCRRLLGAAEPLLHMPAGEQTRSKSLSRRGYVLQRKRPQVLWMLGLLAALGRRRLSAAADDDDADDADDDDDDGSTAAASVGEATAADDERAGAKVLRLVDVVSVPFVTTCHNKCIGISLCIVCTGSFWLRFPCVTPALVKKD